MLPLSFKNFAMTFNSPRCIPIDASRIIASFYDAVGSNSAKQRPVLPIQAQFISTAWCWFTGNIR